MKAKIHSPLPIKLIDGKPMTKWDVLAMDNPPRKPSEGGQPKPTHGLAEDEDYGLPPFVKRVG